MMKRILSILLALTLLLSVSAVFAEDAAETAEAEAAPADDLLVTVNGHEIRESDEILQYYYTSLLGDVSDPEGELDQQVARMYAMSYAVQIQLINERAEAAYTEEDYAAFREQAVAEWNEILEEFMSEAGITEESSEEDRIAARGDVLSYLESSYGYNEDVYVQESMENAAFNNYIQKIADEQKAANPDLAATEEEIQQRYNEMANEEMEYIGDNIYFYEYYQSYGYQFHYIPEGYRGITHILLDVDQALLDNWTDLSARLEESQAPEEATDGTETAENAETPEETEEPVTPEMVEAARQAILDSQKETIDEIMARLANGESFEDLIAEYGTDPGMLDETTLKEGYSVHPESAMFVQAFTNAAAALENVGDVSEPLVTSYGIHILHYLRDVPAGIIEMTEEDRVELQAEIEDERVNLAVSEQIDQWEAEADIVWTEAGEAWKFDQAVVDAYNEALSAAE